MASPEPSTTETHRPGHRSRSPPAGRLRVVRLEFSTAAGSWWV